MKSISIFLLVLLAAWMGYCVDLKRPIRACYATSWSIFRPEDGKFNLTKDYEDKLCNVMYYSFGQVKFDGTSGYIITHTDEADLTKGYKMLNNDLKGRDPDLRTLLAIGGWRHGSNGFKEMVQTKESRAYFIRQSAEFLQMHGKSSLKIS